MMQTSRDMRALFYLSALWPIVGVTGLCSILGESALSDALPVDKT